MQRRGQELKISTGIALEHILRVHTLIKLEFIIPHLVSCNRVDWSLDQTPCQRVLTKNKKYNKF